VIRISCRLGYNFVEALAEHYLAHIPRIISGRVNYSLTLDTKNFTIQVHEGNCNFLKDVYIGKHIRDVSRKNRWNAVEMGKKLNCAPNSISDLYRKKTLTLKKTFWITDVLRHHLVDEVYLSRMCIAPVHIFDKCIITLTGKQVLIKKPEDPNFLIRYTIDDDEKNDRFRTKTDKETYKTI